MADRTVKTTLIANVNGYLEGMEKAAKKTKDLGSEAEKLAQKKEAFNQLGQAGLAVGALAAAGVAVAVSKFADFDQAISNVKAATQESAENMGLLRQAALDFGESSVFTATESANAIEELGKAGLSTADILSGGLKGSLDLASAGELGIARAAEIAATTLSQFGLEGEDAARVADVLAAGAGKALGSVDDLANGLKFVGPVAAAMGISLEETTGILALFAQQGIIGEQAGTSLRGMLSSLTSPSKIAQKEIERLGISLYDSQGGFLGLENAAGQLEGAYAGMTDEQRNFSLGLLFGNEQITGARVLLDAGAEGVAEWTDAVDEAGYASQVAADRLDNLKGDFEQLGGSIETALIQSGSAGNDVLRALTQSATDAVNTFNNLDPAAQGAALGLGGVVAAGGLTLGTIFTLVPKIAEFNAALKVMGPRAELAGKAAGGLAKGLGALAAASAVVTVLDQIAHSAEPAALGIEEITNALLTGDLDAGFAGISSDVSSLDDAITKLFSNNPEEAFDRFGSELFAFTGLSSEVGQSKDAFDSLGASLAGLVSSGQSERAAELFDEIAAAAEEQGVSVEQLKELMPQYRDALAGVENGQILATEAAEDTAVALDGMTDSAGQTEESIQTLADSVRDFADSTISAIGAESAFYQAVDDAAEAFGAEGFQRTLDLTTQAGRDNTDMLLGLATAANESAAATLETTGSQEALKAKVDEGRQALFDQARQFFDTDEAAWEYIDTLVQTPDSITTEVVLSGIENAKAQLQAFYDAWQGRDVTVQFFADTYSLDQAAAASAARYTGQALQYAGPASANGNMFSYANGGFGEGMYSGGTPLYKFAEPETRWEAFISGRPGAEARNREIWKDAGARLGMSSGSSDVNVTIASKGGINLLDYVDVQVSQGVAGANQSGRMVIENGKKGLV